MLICCLRTIRTGIIGNLGGNFFHNFFRGINPSGQQKFNIDNMSTNRRKILAVTTQLKQLRKESLKKRGHGFESRSSQNFFQAFFSQLLKLRSNCEDLSSI